VSTFPFLAVLLCAMGALILFLLVMDRRGKIVAAAKARAARAGRLADRSKEDAARKAEWDGQREALHSALVAQHLELNGEAVKVEQQLAEARQKLQAKQSEHDTLRRAAVTEATQLSEQQSQLLRKQTGLLESEKQEAAAKADLDRLAREVADLERTLAELAGLKEREQHTYSLVPYGGKHGDGRKPLYVECVRSGVVFHPERRELTGLNFNAQELRGEIERRSGALERETKRQGKEPPAPGALRGPYVLFLIRPDGITTYYQALAYLKGFQIDFGYEVVDENWCLDFGGGSPVTSAQPKQSPSAVATIAKSPPVGPVGLPPAIPLISQGGDTRAGILSPLTVAPNGPAASQPWGVSPAVRVPGVAETRDFTLAAGSPRAAVEHARSQGTPAATATNSKSISTSSLPAAVPLVKAGPGLPFGGVATGAQASSGAAGSIREATEGPGVTAASPTGQGGELPQPWKLPGSTPAPGQSGLAGSPQGRGSGGLPSSPAGSGRSQSPAPPLGQVLGNRDFVVTIACFSDHVTIYPGGKQHWWKEGKPQNVEQAVVQNVQDLITGRQKSVRPGEPPYRPLIRFQLAPDGRIRFLQLYPRLEFLQVPMTRENLDE
jgi:hypothetical protein